MSVFKNSDLVNEIVNDITSDAVDRFFLKNFLCLTCGQKCRDNYNLKKHISSWHSSEMTCPRCGSTLKDKDILFKHMKNCFYLCPDPECDKKFKKVQKFEAHKRAHEKYSRRMSI